MEKTTDDNFECRAPQFFESLPAIDSNALHDGADEFFDAMGTPSASKPTTPGALLKVDNNPTLGLELNDVGCSSEEETSRDRRKTFNDLPQGRVILKAKRRSLQSKKGANPDVETTSSDDFNRVRVVLDRLFEGITLDKVEPDKEHSMMTRQDVKVKTPKLALRNRHVERLQLKRPRASTPESKGAVPLKYRAMAEQMSHFQNDTPPRFLTAPQNATPRLLEKQVRSLAVPKSPVLPTKACQRSPVSQQQQSTETSSSVTESYEFKVPDAQQLPKPTGKPLGSTATSSKVPDSVQFKARPVPKACRRSLAYTTSNAPVRAPVRPATRRGQVFVEGSNHTVIQKTVDNYVGVKPVVARTRTRTEPKPFSFEMRDRAARQKKERKIQEAIEQMTRVPKFTAQPLPAYLPSVCDESDASSTISMRSTRSHHCIDPHPKANFKAKPPTVLSAEPFKPRKADKPLTEFSAFELNTERRAKERADFEKALKEMQELGEEANKERRAIREEIEKENLKQLRRNLVHKAKPVPAHILTSKPKIDE